MDGWRIISGTGREEVLYGMRTGPAVLYGRTVIAGLLIYCTPLDASTHHASKLAPKIRRPSVRKRVRLRNKLWAVMGMEVDT